MLLLACVVLWQTGLAAAPPVPTAEALLQLPAQGGSGVNDSGGVQAFQDPGCTCADEAPPSGGDCVQHRDEGQW